MAACPLISTSRTGAAVCLIQLGFFVCACLIQWRRLPKTLRWGALAGILLLGSFVASVGWEPLLKKARQAQQDRWGMRLQIYEQTRRMIPDFDPWGGGAESFRKLSHLYTDPTASNWESFVHNEWLEARLSYGWVGYGILWGMILSWLVALRWRSSRTLPSSFSPFLGVSIGGFLIDARFDIPFQTLSLHLLFTLLVVIALYSGTPKAQASPVGLRS
jgi:hypothetical protein